MAHFITFILVLTFISGGITQFVLPVDPNSALLIREPQGSSVQISLATPIAAPSPSPSTSQSDLDLTIAAIDTSKLSAGERATLSSPGFKIGGADEPISILPPAIGNWHGSGSTMSTITIAATSPNTTTILMNTTLPSNDTQHYAGPWAALTDRMNITINSTQHGNQTTLNITMTPTSPTWVDVQGERESGYASTWPARRPQDFPFPPSNSISSNTSSLPYNITIHGNITSFNLTITNMTHSSNTTTDNGGWFGTWLPTGTGIEGGQSTIHANLTGPGMNITIITPNTTTIITTEPNSTVIVKNETEPHPHNPITAAARSSSSDLSLLTIVTLFFATTALFA